MRQDTRRFCSTIFKVNMLVIGLHSSLENSGRLMKLSDLFSDYLLEDSNFFHTYGSKVHLFSQRTTNACESFRTKYNSPFYASHSNIHQFCNVRFWNRYIKMRIVDHARKVYDKNVSKRRDFVRDKIKENKY